MLTIRIVRFYFDSLKFGVSDAPIKIFWLFSFWEWKFAKLYTVSASVFKLAVLLVPFSSEFLLNLKFGNSSIRIYKDVFMVTCSAKLFSPQHFKFLNRVLEFDNNWTCWVWILVFCFNSFKFVLTDFWFDVYCIKDLFNWLFICQELLVVVALIIFWL